MRIKSVPIRNAILLLAIAAQDEHVRLIEDHDTPKGGELTRAQKTAVALPPVLA